jgi:hypothetical protein
MQQLRRQIQPGKVYRRSDLEFFSSAIDRHLAQLLKEGVLVKMRQGLYYAPASSKFGKIPPDDLMLVESFLKDKNFLMVKPNAYNTLGLGLTQLYNTTWVYNHKRKGEFTFNGKTFEFKIKTAFPNQLSKEFLLVDLLNNLEELAEEPTTILNNLADNYRYFSPELLRIMTQLYGSGRTKQRLKVLYRRETKHA